MTSTLLPRRALALLAGALLPAIVCPAATELDLERIEPVPATEPVPIQDFFRPAYFRSPLLNPSGTHVAALVSGGLDVTRLMIIDLATNESKLVTGLGNCDVYGVQWLNDERLIFSVSAEKYWGVAMGAVDIKATSRPYPLIQFGLHRFIGRPEDDRLSPYVWVSGEGAGKDGGIVTLNTDITNGRWVSLDPNSSNLYSVAQDQNRRVVRRRFPVPDGGLIAGYFSDRHGHLAYSYTAREGLLTLHHYNGEDWDKSPIDMEANEVLAAADEPGQLVVSQRLYDGNPSAVRYVDATTGEYGAEILRDKGYDIMTGPYRDPGTRRIVGFQYDRAIPAAVWFDEGYASLYKIFRSSFPKKAVRIVSNNEANTIFVLGVFTDREPMTYYLVNLEKKSLGPLKGALPWIDPARMSGMSIVKFKTDDGQRLDAYLTLPQGASKENPAPMVVLPHGGPWARDTFGFNGQAQFLASRGYAVLQPNYRGSTGYDWMFPESDQWDFLKMHADVTAATKAMLKTGYVDPQRVAIMGSSFGAYLALSGAVHEPDLYKCAVGNAGVYDWDEVFRDEAYNKYSSPQFGRLKLKLGDPAKEQEKFRAISPIHFVENMKIPMFVAHGKDDPVASWLESKRLVSQLEKHKVPHEKHFVSREAHGMQHLENQVELYELIEDFLARNL